MAESSSELQEKILINYSKNLYQKTSFVLLDLSLQNIFVFEVQHVNATHMYLKDHSLG